MLHDLLVSLLGFTGDVIVEDGGTFKVVVGFDLLSVSEKEAIEKICPLGWYYVQLRMFCDRHAVQWGSSSSEDGFQAYLAAVSAGLGDFLHEYVADVSALEHQILSEGPVPLSYLSTALQKYSITMPVLHALVYGDLTLRRLRGGQVVDFLASFKSGIPLLNAVVQRMLQRVWIVFLKQCMAWMLFGELHDPGSEFFIVRRDGIVGSSRATMGRPHTSFGTMYDGIMKKFVNKGMMGGGGNKAAGATGMGVGGAHGNATGANKHAFNNASFGAGATQDDSFDWNAAFMLRFERLPESAVSPNVASKILFCGKATKLLKGRNAHGGKAGAPETGLPASSSSSSSLSSSFSWMTGNQGEIYAYLCGRHGSGGSGMTTTAVANENQDGGVTDGVKSTNEMVNMFEQTMSLPAQTTPEKFEALIDSMYDSISASLWHHLRDEFSFVDYLHLIRNTYLMGCGELFKFMSDHVVHTMLDSNVDAEPMQAREAQLHLNLNVLKESAKSLDLDDRAILNVLQLGVNTSNLCITDFGGEPKNGNGGSGGGGNGGGEVVTVGAASLKQRSVGSSSDVTTRVSLCGVDRENIATLFASVWTDNLLKRAGMRQSFDSTTATGMSQDRNVFSRTSMAASMSDGTRIQSPVARAVLNRIRMNQSPGSASVAGSALSPASSLASSTVFDSTQQRQHLQQPQPSYSVGAMWLPAPKLVTKGFSLAVDYRTNLSAVATALSFHEESYKHDWRAHIGTPIFRGGGIDAPRGLLLGGMAAVVHADRMGTKALPSGALCTSLHNSLSIGVYYFVQVEGEPLAEPEDELESGAGMVMGMGAEESTRFALFAVLYVSHEGQTGTPLAHTVKRLGTTSSDTLTEGPVSTLRIEYSRSVATRSTSTAAAATMTNKNDIMHVLRVSLDYDHVHDSRVDLDLEVDLDLRDYVRLQGGAGAFVGLTAGGMILPQRGGRHSNGFDVEAESLSFSSRGSSLATITAVSAGTMACHPELTRSLERRLAHTRSFLNITLSVQLHPLLSMILQGDALLSYQRVFTFTMKMRLVLDLLDAFLGKRALGQGVRGAVGGALGYSMRFFAAHLFYYLQVDVFDFLFLSLMKEIHNAKDFAHVMRAHRSFHVKLASMTFLDDASTHDCLERVLLCILRFVGVQQEQQQRQQEQRGRHVLELHEESTCIEKDFYKELGLLFQLLRKTDANALVTTLDFNYFFSGKIAHQH